jgi:hypothetical protein
VHILCINAERAVILDKKSREASIEAVTKFRQITGQVLAADAMIHSTNIAFDVGDQGLDPGNQSGRDVFPI